MALYVNGSKIENVYVGGQKIDRVFANGTLVYESTIYVAKPTVTGAYTYNGGAQEATISGYDSTAMTMSGAKSATNAGTYHVYFTLNKGYAWKDGTTDKLDLTWTIGKLSIAIPSLSTTNFAWIEGDSHSVTVKNIDTNYVTQSGETSVVDSVDTVGKHTVTWSLKNTTSTQWTDGTTAAKSATWLTAFVVGTSHWKNDLYNQGWSAGKFASYWADIDMGSASQPYITVKKNTEGNVGVLYYNESRSSILPLHMTVKASSSDTAWTRLACVKSGGSPLYAYKPTDTAQTHSLGTSWTTLYGTESSVSGSHYPGIVFSGDPTHYIMRIWHD